METSAWYTVQPSLSTTAAYTVSSNVGLDLKSVTMDNSRAAGARGKRSLHSR